VTLVGFMEQKAGFIGKQKKAKNIQICELIFFTEICLGGSDSSDRTVLDTLIGYNKYTILNTKSVFALVFSKH